VTRSVDERLDDILAAIARARVADKRLRLAESLGDDTGLQLAFQAILYNQSVIGEAVSALPAEILEQDPQTPWSEIAAMRDVVGQPYHRIISATIHRTVEVDLGSLEIAVRRLRAVRR
jgi:uncharacterized protein with HEPN domain